MSVVVVVGLMDENFSHTHTHKLKHTNDDYDGNRRLWTTITKTSQRQKKPPKLQSSTWHPNNDNNDKIKNLTQ